MYVCLCNGVTEKQLLEAARRGLTDINDVSRELGVATGCGQCLQEAWQVINPKAATHHHHQVKLINLA